MKIRVLLVDDEREFVETVAQRLESRGLYVITAYSGDEALERLKQEDVDIVVLDMVMPGKDGISTLDEIKHLKPLVEVILLTGHATLDTATASLQRGAYYYLIKPAEMRDLLENIINAYRRKAEHEERIRQGEIRRLTAVLNSESM